MKLPENREKPPENQEGTSILKRIAARTDIDHMQLQQGLILITFLEYCIRGAARNCS
jgi:hypothetical protein